MNIDAPRRNKRVAPSRRRPVLRSTRSESGFSGFGAAPPPDRSRGRSFRFEGGGKEKPPDVQPSGREADVLKEAEKMVRVILQNPKEKLSAESIHRVLDHFSAQKPSADSEREEQSIMLKSAEKLVRLALQNPRETLSSDSIHKAVDHLSVRLTSDVIDTRRDNEEEEDNAQVLEDAQRLVRLLLGKPSEKLSSDSIHRVMEQYASKQTSKRYRFLLDKPWRTSSAYDDSSHSQLQADFFSEHDARTPRRFKSKDEGSSTLTSDLLVQQLAETQLALEQARKRIRHLEEYETKGELPSNESLSIFDGDESGKAQKQQQARWEELMLDTKRQHKAEMESWKRKFESAEEKARQWEQKLEESDLYSRVKVSALERKLADAGRIHDTTLKAEEGLTGKIQFLEKSLAETELDRRLKISALEKKIARLEREKHEQITGSDQGLSMEETTEECNQLRDKILKAETDRETLLSDYERAIKQTEESLLSRISVLESQLNTVKRESGELEIADNRIRAELAAENEKLARKLLESEERVSSMRHEIESLNKPTSNGPITSDVEREQSVVRIETLEEQNTELSSRIDVLTKDLESARDGLATADATIVKLTDSVRDVENRERILLETTSGEQGLDLAREIAEGYRTKLDASEKKNASMIQSISDLKHELKCKITVIEEMELSADKSQTEVERSLHSVRSEVDNLREERRVAEERLQDACLTAQKYRAQVGDREVQIVAFKKSIQNLEQDLEDKNRQILEEKQMANNAASEHSRAIESLMEEAARKDEALKETVAKAEIDVSDATSKITVLEELLKDASGRLQSAEEKVLESVGYSTKLCEVEQALEAKHAEIESLDSHLTSAMSTIEQHKIENRQLQSQVEKLTSGFAKVRETNKQLETQLESLPVLTEELGRAKVSLHDLNQELETVRGRKLVLEQEVCTLTTKLEESIENVGQLDHTLAQTKLEKDRTMQSLNNLEKAQAREQEVLSAELRESETTIAYLLEEVEALKPLATDLERTEAALVDAQKSIEQYENQIEQLTNKYEEQLLELKSKLDSSNEEMQQLRDELIPLTIELQQANHELAVVKSQANERSLGGEGGTALLKSLNFLEQDVVVLRTELADSTKALERAESRAAEAEAQHQQEVSKWSSEFQKSADECNRLKSEVDSMQPKVSLVDCRESENSALKQEMEQRERELNTCRLQLQAMEEEQNYSRARIGELNDLLHYGDNPDRALEGKIEECAKLRAERDTLRQKLTVVEAMATALEQDNRQKKEFVQKLLSRNGTAQDTAEAFVESLQSELERTLKRCADLSLQLADSQYRITQLTESIRRLKKAPQQHSAQTNFSRAHSFDSPSRRQRRSISSLLTSGMAAMDESLRSVKANNNNSSK